MSQVLSSGNPAAAAAAASPSLLPRVKGGLFSSRAFSSPAYYAQLEAGKRNCHSDRSMVGPRSKKYLARLKKLKSGLPDLKQFHRHFFYPLAHPWILFPSSFSDQANPSLVNWKVFKVI